MLISTVLTLLLHWMLQKYAKIKGNFMKGIRETIRQLWEKVDRRAKKDQLQAVEKRLSRVEIELAELKRSIKWIE